MPTTAAELSRITVITPHRRLDVALPSSLPVAELLPELLRHAGQPVGSHADYQQWELRQSDGATLATARGLHVQGVRDGTVLHLVPATLDWPDITYGDPAAAVAAGAGAAARWSPAASATALLTGAALLLAGALALTMHHASAFGRWPGTLLATGLLAATVVTARRHRHARELLAVSAWAFTAMTAAAWVDSELAPLAACVAWLLTVLLTATTARVPSPVDPAGCMMGLLALAAVLVAQTPGGVLAAAAVLACVLVCGAAGLPVLALWLARLPQPPATSAVMFPAVARADRLLTGWLVAWSVATVAVAAVLVVVASPAAMVLAALTGAAPMVRARTFVALHHRLTLLSGGVPASMLAAGGMLMALPAQVVSGLLVLVVSVAVLLTLAAGNMSRLPRLGRLAHTAETLVVISVVPTAAWALALYTTVAAL